MTGEPARAIANLKKRRATIKGAFTRLDAKTRDCKSSIGRPGIAQAAALYLEKIREQGKEFKSVQEQLIDLADLSDDEGITREQEALLQQEEMCESFILRLQKLLTKGDERPKCEAEVNTIRRRLR